MGTYNIDQLKIIRTRKRTPTGAKNMIHCVIVIMITVMEVKKVKTGLASSPTTAIAIPKT